MAKGICSNCGRDDVNMQPGTGRCCQCSKHIKGTKDDPELRKQKLAEAKELFQNLKPGERKPSAKEIKTEGKIGLCTKCGMDKRIYGCHGIDLCGHCKSAFYNKSKNGGAKKPEKPLRPARARQSYPFSIPETEKAIALVSLAAAKGYDTPGKTEHILLKFLDKTDADILAFLQTEARRCRRSLDQQVMWIIQEAVERKVGQP